MWKEKKVYGVLVQKGENYFKIEAPIVISTAGIYNTFQNLLKPEVAAQSYYSNICEKLKPTGISSIHVFLGLNASNEELNLKKHNIRSFSSVDSEHAFFEYLKLSDEKTIDAELPLMYITFPSAKDPNWWVKI